MVVVVSFVAIGDERVGDMSQKLLASLLRILLLKGSFVPAPIVLVVIMMTVLVGCAAISLEIDQSPSRLLGVGVVAPTKDGDVPRVIVSTLVAASGAIAPFIWLEVIVDLVASTVPPNSPFGPRIPVDVVQGAVSAGWCP